MHWQCHEPQSWPQRPGVGILESEPGEARDAVVARWLSERRESGGPSWHLQCSTQEGGIWAGLGTLIEDLAPALRERAPDLLNRHAHELCLVVPALRSQLTFPQSLTDTIDDKEKTRKYPADRAYRSLHGLIELLSDWHDLTDPGPWSIACESYDDATALVRRFFTELVRRRGSRLDLHLLVTVSPGGGEQVAAQLDRGDITAALRLMLPRGRSFDRSQEAMTRLAGDLEAELTHDAVARDAQLPRLIAAWRQSDFPERAVPWELVAMERYNHEGLYEASLPYAVEIEAALDHLYDEDRARYLAAVHALYSTYVPLGQAEAARVIMEQALPRVEDAADLARYCYLLAMLHARFLEQPDQTKAEQYLQRALAILPSADIPEEERHFLTVFTMNGLAFVRLRQRRVEEALDLCSMGIARLNEHLGPERHRLHRSVLLFNIAQVHAQIGPYEDAIVYFSQAIEMDPNYSEYYNDRGAVYLKMERFEDAERDYLQAIKLSPPYAEVWANLGQCYRAMERMEDAICAYTRTLDLDPSSVLAVVGRADAQFALNREELALQDYDRALTMEPEQPLVLANRAILHYEAGSWARAVADLDAAVGLAADVAELYQNRAVALRELGRFGDAARDLNTYLQLRPDADDRDEVESSLSSLAAQR